MEIVKTYTKPKPLEYPKGSLLFDVRYTQSGGESFEVVYYDPRTKRLEVNYEKPIIDIWFLKKEYRTHDYQIPHIELDKCYPVYCRPSQIASVIAKEVGGKWEELYNHIKDAWGVYDIKKKMCECPYVFKGDFQEDVYFRLRWLNQYGKSYDVTKVERAFLDIEVDVLDRSIDPRDYTSAPQPINAVSLILEKQKICALFVLGERPRDLLDKKYHELLDKQSKALNWLRGNVDTFKKKVREVAGGEKHYLDDYAIRVHMFDYNQEAEMIKLVFDYINKYRPWFTLSWNAPFDDNYLKNRIAWLGYDPVEFFIPKEFKTKRLYFSEDRNKKATVKDSKDFFYASSFTQYLCQERLYAATRKSQANLRSYSLDYVAKITAKITKLSDTKSGTFREFAYTDTIKFLLYNIRDTVAQLAVELNCGDCGSFASRSYTFCTAFAKCFQETHIVRNAREFFFEKEGYVQTCRLLVPEGVDTAYEGAFVADPALNYPTGYIVNGKNVNNIIFGAVDADAKAYYPSSKMGENQDPMSLHYKCIMDNEELFLSGKLSNKSYSQEYYWYDSNGNRHKKDLTGQVINTYKNGNIASLMYNWFNAPSIGEIFDYVDANI